MSALVVAVAGGVVAGIVAAAGPWDAVVQVLVIVGGLVTLAGGAWMVGRTKQAASVATAASTAATTAATAVGTVATGVEEVRAAVGTPNGLGNLTEAVGKIHGHLSTIATIQSDHAQQDLRFHDEARAVFERQNRINERTGLQLEGLRHEVALNGDATRTAGEAAEAARDIAKAALAAVQALDAAVQTLDSRVAHLEQGPPAP